MAKAKRPRPKPDVSKGPSKLRSGWPKDTRAPKRGKPAGAPTKPAQQAKPANKAPIGGTSVGGKPTGPANVERIASTETPRKPAVAEPKPKPRRLNERELRERDKRFREAFGKKRRLEKEKKRVTADLSSEIKELATECDQLHDELESGYEQLKQGELPLEPADAELEAGASTPSMPTAAAGAALAKVAARVEKGGNGAAKVCPSCGSSDPEKSPRGICGDAFHDIAPKAAKTSGAPDDIAAAVQRERGGEARP